MKKIPLAMAVLLSYGITLTVYSAADRRAGKDKKCSATEQQEDKLTGELRSILRLVAGHMPFYQDKAFLMSRRDAVVACFIKALGCNLRYSRAPYHMPDINRHFKPLPLLWLQKERIAYLRLDAFNSDVVDQFRQLHDILSFKRSLGGLIIDLRQCRTFDYKSVLASLDSLEKAYQGQMASQAAIALLTGPDTLGAVEYFIYQLRNSRAIKAITVGLPTAGMPFQYRALSLTGGGYLLLPQIPPAVAKPADFGAQNPTIKLTDNRQGSYDSENSNPDPTVKYSSELLLALNLIGNRAKQQ